MKLNPSIQLVTTVILLTVSSAISGFSETSESIEVIVTERGANHKIVQRVTWWTNAFGDVTARTNRYTELATGLNYRDNGVWKESKAEIKILNDGTGAIGSNTGHKVRFKPNLDANGVVEITTPDGKVLRSQIFGLGYYDRVTRQSEIIAIVKDVEGELHGDNEVVYPDAFNGVDADVRFRYTRAGIEQDVILRSQPPKPQDFGLNVNNTYLEVFTEFIVTADPTITTAVIPGTQLTDDKLKFGKMVLGRGRAFPVGEENDRRRSVPTGKMWITVDDRRVLLEAVEYKSVKKELDALPESPSTASLTTKPKSFLASNGRKIPAMQTASATPSKARFKKQSRLASLESRNRDGYVLDYIAVQEWTEDQHAVFESGETYLISAGYWPNEITFEAGAVIKFADDEEYGGFGHTLGVMGDVHCPESGTATLTSVHDNTVGETIDTSPRDPNVAAVYLEMAWGNPTLKNLTFKQAYVGIYGGSELVLSNVTFLECQAGILGSGPLALTNVTAIDCGTLVDYTGSGNVSCAFNGSKISGHASGDLVLYDSGSSLAGVSLKLDRCCMDGFNQNINTLGSSIFAANGTFSWTRPCSPLDSDWDGLTDSWEIVHFGNLNQSDADDYDGDGTSNYDEYNTATNPNDIRFVARFENLWVSNRTVSGYCEMLTGKPALMKLLVNSTDLSTVSWQAFTSNFSVTLPDSDTNHTVLVALRGMIATNAPVTDNTKLTLDRVPPVLCITNPVLVSAASTVVKPYLQLQGYGDEPLTYLHYNITNEMGLLTNQQFFVTDQAFDTNRFDFTTNHFQAFDMALATNVNQITLRVCDRAGNVTTTNMTVTLDFSGDTTAPELALLWPTNGMHISGTNFYIRGRIDDETATLSARVIDANELTNEIVGIVERNGMFWVENAPLAAGTSTIEITATDAAGNVNTTNFTVVKCSVTLAITGTPGDLYKPKGNVYGTISDTNYAVTVNGVAATVNESGHWSANDVPIYGIGTATFDVMATPAINGGGSAGGNPSVSNSKEVEMNSAIDVSSHSCSWRWDLTNVFMPLYYSWEKGYASMLKPQTDGNWRRIYSGTVTRKERSDSTGEYTASAAWSSTGPIGFPLGVPFETYIPDVSVDQYVGNEVLIVEHYFAAPPKMHWFHNGKDSSAGDDYLEIAAKTELKLYTGGKASISRKNLFRLSASGEEYFQPLRPPWVYTGWKAIDRSKIQIMGKTPGSDGNVWTVLPDNAQMDITVTAQGIEHFRANWGCQKYKAYFKAYVAMPFPTGPKEPWLGLDTYFGHCWWAFISDAPISGLLYLKTSMGAAVLLNQELGYSTPYQYTALISSVPGEVTETNGESSVERLYRINFDKLIEGLNFTYELSQDPGFYNIGPPVTYSTHNCISVLKEAANEAGVNLPNESWPQNLGVELKNTPQESNP